MMHKKNAIWGYARVGVRFCRAMLDDREFSTLVDIAARMGVKSNYASQYKKRLLVARVIEQKSKLLRFALPEFAKYLRSWE